MKSVQITITELQNPLFGERLEKLITLIIDNPFGCFNRMALQRDQRNLNFSTFESSQVFRFVTENSTAYINLLTGDMDETDGGLSLSFTKSEDKNFLSFTIREDYLGMDHDTSTLLNYVRSVVTLMPKFDHGKITSLLHYPTYYREIGLSKVQKCFGMFLGWVHLLSPSAYLPYFSTESLIHAPALKVETWNNEIILIMNYEEPFAHSTPETVIRLSELTAYLRLHSQMKAIKTKE